MSTSTIDLAKKVFRRSEQMAYREIAKEVLLVPVRLDPENSVGIFTLNPTAALIWHHVDGLNTVETISDLLYQRFDVSKERALADTSRCIVDLASCQAIEEVWVDGETP